MLRLTAFEFMVRALPEAFVCILASYTLAAYKIDLKRYIISSVVFATSVYFIRMLPINYGVHTILSVIMQTFVIISINKMEVILAIKSSIISVICLFLLEVVNMLGLSFIFKEQLAVSMLNLKLKTIYGLPSLICFAIIALCYYNYLRKKDKLKYV